MGNQLNRRLMGYLAFIKNMGMIIRFGIISMSPIQFVPWPVLLWVYSHPVEWASEQFVTTYGLDTISSRE